MALTKLNNQSIAALTDFNLSTDDLPGGSILQVLSINQSTLTSLGSTVDNIYRDYGTATITPSSATSKVLVLHYCEFDVQGGFYPSITNRIKRGGTVLISKVLRGYTGNSSNHIIDVSPITYLDSPGTTSPVTYTFDATNGTGSSVSGTYAGRINPYNGCNTILFEIAG